MRALITGMRHGRKLFLALALVWGASSGEALALSVENVRVSNDGSRVFFDFDVQGRSGESGDLTLEVKLKGTRFTADQMDLDGDTGLLTPGRGKRVVWNLLKDLPRGHSGDLAWDLDLRERYQRPAPRRPDPEPVRETPQRTGNFSNTFGGF